ncbi:MAG: HD domain-containing protein [Candidatus Peribacteria bacterium]|jgi:putative hydrolase of HD superfamily|nr:HD domain-containing protein [Candidatus Peribacteria bacterium]
MQHLLLIRKLYDLKTVYRDIPIQNKYESSAEHSRSAMLLADYFMDKLQLNLDRAKVFELLLYHDLAEIEIGDISLADTEARKNKKKAEYEAMEHIASTLPSFMGEKYKALYEEFEGKETPEARFAQAMDKLDAQLQCFNTPDHELDKMKEAFLPYSEELLRQQQQKHFTDFPEILDFSDKIIQFYKDNGYLSEE